MDAADELKLELEHRSRGETFGELYEMGLKQGWFPSFEQYAKNPAIREKMKLAKDNMFQQIDNNSQAITKVRQHKYFFETMAGNRYECATLEKVHDIMIQEGCKFEDLEFRPEVVKDISATYTIEVTFKDIGRRS